MCKIYCEYNDITYVSNTINYNNNKNNKIFSNNKICVKCAKYFSYLINKWQTSSQTLTLWYICNSLRISLHGHIIMYWNSFAWRKYDTSKLTHHLWNLIYCCTTVEFSTLYNRRNQYKRHNSFKPFISIELTKSTKGFRFHFKLTQKFHEWTN